MVQIVGAGVRRAVGAGVGAGVWEGHPSFVSATVDSCGGEARHSSYVSATVDS